MANNNEIDPLLTLELSGVKTYESQEEAWGARLYEWLNTYQGGAMFYRSLNTNRPTCRMFKLRLRQCCCKN